MDRNLRELSNIVGLADALRGADLRALSLDDAKLRLRDLLNNHTLVGVVIQDGHNWIPAQRNCMIDV